MRALWTDLAISGVGAVAVIVSSVVMYAALALVLHWWGPRLRGSTSSVTMALAAVVGSIAARCTLGNHPTMAGGLVALATLLVMERIFGALARAARRTRRDRHR